MEYVNGGMFGGAISPSAPFRSNYPTSTVSDIGRPLSAIMARKRVVWRGDDWPRFIQCPTESADNTAPLNGALFADGAGGYGRLYFPFFTHPGAGPAVSWKWRER